MALATQGHPGGGQGQGLLLRMAPAGAQGHQQAQQVKGLHPGLGLCAGRSLWYVVLSLQTGLGDHYHSTTNYRSTLDHISLY